MSIGARPQVASRTSRRLSGELLYFCVELREITLARRSWRAEFENLVLNSFSKVGVGFLVATDYRMEARQCSCSGAEQAHLRPLAGETPEAFGDSGR